MAWVPGHIEFGKNERLDELAKRGLQQSLLSPLVVPISMVDVRARMMTELQWKRLLLEKPERERERDMEIRKAKMLLAQYTGHVSTFQPVSLFFFAKKTRRCECSRSANKTVGHYVLRWRLTNQPGRNHLPSLREHRGKSIRDTIMQWPNEVLGFLLEEKFIYTIALPTSPRVLNDVEHCLLRYPLRNASRRLC